MKRALVALAALAGVGLVIAAGNVLVNGSQFSVTLVKENVPANVAEKVDETVAATDVQVRDAVLVVNKDGSAAVGASLHNLNDFEVALMGVVVSVEGRRLPVNSTPMWLPVPAGEDARVGAASDAGGFVLPDGVDEGAHAEVEFRFADGMCVLADITAAARTDEHRSVFPKSGEPIGPVTSDEPPAGTVPCRP